MTDARAEPAPLQSLPQGERGRRYPSTKPTAGGRVVEHGVRGIDLAAGDTTHTLRTMRGRKAPGPRAASTARLRRARNANHQCSHPRLRGAVNDLEVVVDIRANEAAVEPPNLHGGLQRPEIISQNRWAPVETRSIR